MERERKNGIVPFSLLPKRIVTNNNYETTHDSALFCIRFFIAIWGGGQNQSDWIWYEPGVLGKYVLGLGQASISANTGVDANLPDNQYILTQLETGSFDPNFIEVSPTGVGNNGLIPLDTETLEYTIHFQNTGTDTARFIVVTDVINDDLEIVSFQMIAASHDHTLELLDNDIFRWTFNGIN